jgi:predicted P-loop ATPase
MTAPVRAALEAVKAFASRKTDRSRPAYGRHVIEQPRRCILFATTNEDAYLKSQTGNRRFWPVKTGRVDVDGLRRDRDQLWAEAANAEAAGASIVLPKRLWSVAAAEQGRRLEADPWDDVLSNLTGETYPAPGGHGREERVATQHLLQRILGIPTERQNMAYERRLAGAMRRLGWAGPKVMRMGGEPERGYWRPVPVAQLSASDARPPWSRDP